MSSPKLAWLRDPERDVAPSLPGFAHVRHGPSGAQVRFARANRRPQTFTEHEGLEPTNDHPERELRRRVPLADRDNIRLSIDEAVSPSDQLPARQAPHV